MQVFCHVAYSAVTKYSHILLMSQTLQSTKDFYNDVGSSISLLYVVYAEHLI